MTVAVSLFSGGGGFCEGARLAGWRTLWAVEADEHACDTHAANFPEVSLFRGDIRRFLKKDELGAPTARELSKRNVDVVYGGPPCQGFSQIGPRKVSDPRNKMYQEFVRVVRLLKPKAFILENVPNMIAMKNGIFKQRIISAFKVAGYRRVAVLPATASDFGVPQLRKRVFVIGIRDDLLFAGDFATQASQLLESQKTAMVVTVYCRRRWIS